MASNLRPVHHTERSLADGFLDEFERALFGIKPYLPNEVGPANPAFDAWREKMMTMIGCPQSRIAAMHDRSLPMKQVEPGSDGELSRAAGDMLRPIGAKIAPHLSGEQATAWRKAVVMALSDLPAHVVLSALPKALHMPMRFLSDVETEVRKIANKEIAALNSAVRALGQLTGCQLWRVADAIEEEPVIGI